MRLQSFESSSDLNPLWWDTLDMHQPAYVTITWRLHPGAKLSFTLSYQDSTCTVMSRERHGVSIPETGLFNNRFVTLLITKKSSNVHITDPLWADSPHKGPVMRNAFPCHDVKSINLTILHKLQFNETGRHQSGKLYIPDFVHGFLNDLL